MDENTDRRQLPAQHQEPPERSGDVAHGADGRRQPTTYERQLAHRQRNPRHPRQTLVNFALAVPGALLLAVALDNPRGSACLGFLALPLLPAQVGGALVPSLFCLARERMTRGSRLLLLALAILGPLATAGAWIYLAQNGSNC